MAKYSSKPVEVNQPADELFDKISNLNAFQERLDQLPDEAKARLGDVRFTADSIIINAPAVGEMKFNIVERLRPSRVKLSAEQSPVPFSIIINLSGKTEASTEVQTELDVDIPTMLRPIIGSKMQEAADKFGELFTTFFGQQ